MTDRLHELSESIVRRLQAQSEMLREQFRAPRIGNTRYAIVDELLPDDAARDIHRAFPALGAMRLMSSFRERKYTSKSLETMDALVHDAIFAFQAPQVIAAVAAITGMRELSGDPQLYAGGISAMARGQFLQPHIDNSHDAEGRLYRVLYLLYYVTPEWASEKGGSLELWDERVRTRVEIPSLFNRLVIMETNRSSFHSVSAVKADGARLCVSNYYFSPHSPNGTDGFHITFFQARPEQPIMRLLATADGYARSLVRRVFRRGLARKDVYTGAARRP
jgi:Rps23 Pro-64 3,4-dihydroxylase Tpa1-like proline 4-hydroxylase